MPFRCFFKASFQKAFDKLPNEKQELTVKALEAIDRYLNTGEAVHGLGVRKLYDSGQRKTFEARAGIDLRIVWVQTKDEVVFALLGNHDEVRRFLKNLT